MTTYFVKFHTKHYDDWTGVTSKKFYEELVTLILVTSVNDIYKAIHDKFGVYPDGIDFMVAVP